MHVTFYQSHMTNSIKLKISIVPIIATYKSISSFFQLCAKGFFEFENVFKNINLFSNLLVCLLVTSSQYVLSVAILSF